MIIAAQLVSRLALMAMLLGSVVSCSSVSKGPGGQVSKVKSYLLQPTEFIQTTDPAILFERAYRLHGTVTLAQQMERAGHYYNVWWKANDPTGPVTVRLEYRQKNTGLTVKKQEQVVTELRRKNENEFRVVGAEFTGDGPVVSWRITLLRGKEVLASQQSFLWN
jgi:hypothetical protein